MSMGLGLEEVPAEEVHQYKKMKHTLVIEIFSNYRTLHSMDLI